jgi:hypothetical protein
MIKRKRGKINQEMKNDGCLVKIYTKYILFTKQKKEKIIMRFFVFNF